MPDDSSIEKGKTWIHNNPGIFSKIVSLAFLAFGIVVIIGAVMNWDWLFKPDVAYHNKWTIGQISRYFGRDTARIIAFVAGIVVLLAGGYWSYVVFLKK